jgi:hypothetical protein
LLSTFIPHTLLSFLLLSILWETTIAVSWAIVRFWSWLILLFLLLSILWETTIAVSWAIVRFWIWSFYSFCFLFCEKQQLLWVGPLLDFEFCFLRFTWTMKSCPSTEVSMPHSVTQLTLADIAVDSVVGANRVNSDTSVRDGAFGAHGGSCVGSVRDVSATSDFIVGDADCSGVVCAGSRTCGYAAVCGAVGECHDDDGGDDGSDGGAPPALPAPTGEKKTAAAADVVGAGAADVVGAGAADVVGAGAAVCGAVGECRSDDDGGAPPVTPAPVRKGPNLYSNLYSMLTDSNLYSIHVLSYVSRPVRTNTLA